MSWFMPGSGAIEALRVTGGIQYSISLNKWCSLGLFIACPEWGKWWRIGFLCRASFLIQMKSQEVHSSHFGDNEVVKLLVLCGHQELHLCTRRVLCLRRPGWHRYIIIVVSYLFMRTFVSLGKSWLCSPAIQHLNEKAQLKMHNLLSSVAFAPSCLLAAFSLLTALRVWPSLHFTSACFWMFKSAFSTYRQNTWEKQDIALIYIFLLYAI